MGPLPAREARPAIWRALLKRVVAVFVVILVMDLLLFIPAGRLDWPAAWLLSLLYGVFLLVYAVWGTLKAPDLLKERSQVADNVKIWDKVIMAVYTVLLLATLVLTGLDVGRFQWSHTPVAVQMLGLMGMVLAGGLVFWTILTNAYLGRMVRIQQDRGHQVVTGGPYRYVRHPMYVGIILLFPCMAFHVSTEAIEVQRLAESRQRQVRVPGLQLLVDLVVQGLFESGIDHRPAPFERLSPPRPD